MHRSGVPRKFAQITVTQLSMLLFFFLLYLLILTPPPSFPPQQRLNPHHPFSGGLLRWTQQIKNRPLGCGGFWRPAFLVSPPYAVGGTWLWCGFGGCRRRRPNRPNTFLSPDACFFAFANHAKQDSFRLRTVVL